MKANLILMTERYFFLYSILYIFVVVSQKRERDGGEFGAIENVKIRDNFSVFR